MILTYNKLVNPGLLASQIRANVTSLAGGNFGVTQSPQSPTEQMLYISVPDTLSAADQQAVGTVVANHVAAQSDTRAGAGWLPDGAGAVLLSEYEHRAQN